MKKKKKDQFGADFENYDTYSQYDDRGTVDNKIPTKKLTREERKMIRASKRKSQIRLFKAKHIHCFKVNAYRAANIDQIRNDLLVLIVFTNV